MTNVHKLSEKIDPRSADINWCWGYDSEDSIGRQYFARALGSDTWVHFGDLPDETRRVLWERLESGKPPVTAPFNVEIERMADAISNVYGDDFFGGSDRARALEAALAALKALRDPALSDG